MRFVALLLITKDTFRSNILRTLLTMLAVIGGIAAILVLVSLGNGLQKLTVDRISTSYTLRMVQVTKGASEILSISDKEVEQFRANPNVELVSPRRSLSVTASVEGTTTESVIHALDPKYAEYEVPPTVHGQAYAGGETGEAVISTALSKLLTDSDASTLVGRQLVFTIFVAKGNAGEYDRFEKKMTIRGVVEAAEDNFAIVPLLSIADLPLTEYNALKVLSKSNDMRDQVRADIQSLGYTVESPADTLAEVNAIFNIVKAMLGVLGFFALVIAAIGMFNTLTISLVERTREVGIMKAIGASNANVWLIFVMEAALFGLLGGVLGIAAGYGISEGLNAVISMLANRFGGESMRLFLVPWNTAGFLVLGAFLIGLMTGLYPSIRAARLNPLNALRYE